MCLSLASMPSGHILGPSAAQGGKHFQARSSLSPLPAGSHQQEQQKGSAGGAGEQQLAGEDLELNALCSAIRLSMAVDTGE